MNHQSKLPPIMIVGAHTMGLALVRAFGFLEIERVFISYDRNDMGRASRYASKVFESPQPESQMEQFVDFLVKLAPNYPGAVLFPASDPALKALSRNKEILSNHYIVACPEWSIVELIIDKKRTYAVAEKVGIPCPKTLLPHSEAEVEDYSRQAEYPCLVKPTQSHLYFSKFHHKMVLAQNRDELINAFRQASDVGLEVILQEFIPGNDSVGVNYNSYANNGKVVVEFTAKKVRSAPPRIGSPCVVMSAEVPEVYEVGKKLINALGFYGYSCTEFKLDSRDGLYKLMEVNGRHNLSGLLATRCGLNFPVMHYHHLVFGEIPAQTRYELGKYWIDLSRDFAYYFTGILAGKYSVGDFIKPYFSKHVFAIYDPRDMGPFFMRDKILIRDLFTGERSL